MTNASLKVNRTDEGSGKADRGVSHATHFRFGLAAVLHLTGRIADRVASAYDGLLSMDEKETAKIYFDMGTDLVHKGNSDDALAALRKTLELQPDNGDAWLYLGMVHSDRQEPDDAVEAFQQAITLGKDGPKLRSRLAEAFADAGNYQAAAGELQHAVELDPLSAESFFRLGVALDNLKKYEEAVAAFEKAIDLAPEKRPITKAWALRWKASSGTRKP